MNLSLRLCPFPYQLSTFNPFANTIELIRFVLYEGFNIGVHGYRMAAFIVLLGVASYGCDPAQEMMSRKNRLGS